MTFKESDYRACVSNFMVVLLLPDGVVLTHRLMSVLMRVCVCVCVCLCVRMEYDAFRIDVESKRCSPELQQTFQQHKLKFEQLRQVLDVKFQLLDENRVHTQINEPHHSHYVLISFRYAPHHWALHYSFMLSIQFW